jgi:hypothetical protein
VLLATSLKELVFGCGLVTQPSCSLHWPHLVRREWEPECGCCLLLGGLLGTLMSTCGSLVSVDIQWSHSTEPPNSTHRHVRLLCSQRLMQHDTCALQRTLTTQGGPPAPGAPLAHACIAEGRGTCVWMLLAERTYRRKYSPNSCNLQGLPQQL